MTNPTSNYNFQMPTTTDLVTDLPADFEVFGQAVDTRLKALQPGTTLGDLAYSSATANTNTRLGIGTNGQVLAVAGGVPAWTTTADVTPLTTKGDLFTFTTVDARVGVGANGTVLTADSAQATGLKWAAVSAATAIAGAYATVATQESTTSTSYTDLATAGPAVTVTTGTKALVMISAAQRSTISGAQAYMNFAVSGATTRTPQTNENTNTSWGSVTGGMNETASVQVLVTGLTAGSNVFTAKYAAPTGDSVSFQFRKITVIDLGS